MSDFLISDLHISAQARDRYRLTFLKNLPALVKQTNASCVCILGDITHQKDKHLAWLVNQVVDLMADLAQDISVYILAGNHDGETPDELFFRFLRNIPDIQFIDEPTVLGKTMWLPHTRNHERDWHDLDFEDVNCIYTHNTFRGSLNENKQEMDGIPLGALPNLPIYSGDVHVPQKLANLTYVGAPYTINFGDTFEPRALLVERAKAVKSIPLIGPQKRVLRTGTDGWWKGGANKGDIVRVQVEIRREEYPRWAELYENSLKVCAKRGLVADSVVPVLIEDDVQKTDLPTKRAAPRSDLQEFQLYCKRNQVDESTKKIGEEIL